MTTKAEQIRSLASEGIPIAEIARRLGIRYQHAYNECRKTRVRSLGSAQAAEVKNKPSLFIAALAQSGFQRGGNWTIKNGRLSCPGGIPDVPGVYAFALSGIVRYVGVASRSLRHRLRFYANPGISQRTNIRLNALIRECIEAGEHIEVAVASPPSMAWNGLTVLGPEGLEAGLIRDYSLPWNVRGAKD
jgi:hypothetical protein